MKAIRLNIVLGDKQEGATVEMENAIARHFIAKGWGEEVEIPEEVEPEITEEPVKHERKPVGRKQFQK
jgi:hypothetical protein